MSAWSMNQYYGSAKDVSSGHNRTAVLLTNLGTPDGPTTSNLRTYLTEFLSDSRVVEFPRLLWKVILYGIIINFRSPRSAATYRKIWTEDGSPLLVGTNRLTDKVNGLLGSDYQAFVAMRYGNPSIKDTLTTIHDSGFRKLIVLPLYPQYSASTSGSTFDAIAQVYLKQRRIPTINFISEYYQHPLYIEAVANTVRDHWNNNGRAELLLFSFHGIPKRYVDSGDPYAAHCELSSQLIAESLGLGPDQWKLVYQSRFGREPWLEPYCDETLKSLPSEGIKNVDIVCPGFSIDCLETLEEINMENCGYFLASGGETYRYISCLNDSDAHAKLVCQLVDQNN